MTYQIAVELYETAKKATSQAWANYNARQSEFDAIQECAKKQMEAKKIMEELQIGQ